MPTSKGLLYVGTEAGMYISFDDGESWSPFQLNLPVVPVTDLAIKNNNLIAATQGRSFWLIDDLSPLHQLNSQVENISHHLFKPMDSYRIGGGNGKTSKTAGTNHPGGVLVNYFVRDTVKTDTISISFHETGGDQIKLFSTHPKENESMLDIELGFNTVYWDMRYNGAKTFEGMILWAATIRGPVAVPDTYTVKMTVNGQETTQDFTLLKDPRSSASQAYLQSQFNFLIKIRDKLTETNEGIINIRKAKEQISDVLKKADGNDELKELGKSITENMSEIEHTLYQTKNESGQDPLNFPIRLNNKLGHLAFLAGIGDFKPTNSSLDFYDEVVAKIDEQLSMLNNIFESGIKRFNQKVKESEIDAVKLAE